MKHLFETIRKDGFGLGLRGDKLGNPNLYWYCQLPDEYKVFGGNYHGFREDVRHQAHKFTSRSPVEPMLAPPQTTSKADVGKFGTICVVSSSSYIFLASIYFCLEKLVHYTQDEYAKRLVGNAFSIPVLEELLKPLQRIFANDGSYGPKYKYTYEWEKKGSVGNGS